MADILTPNYSAGVSRRLRDMGDGSYAEVVALAATPTIDIGDVQLLAGTAIIGKVGIDQTTPGTTNGVAVNSSALPTGASTAANQALELTKLDTLLTAVGSAADAAGDPTVIGLLKQIAANTTP